MIVSAHPACEAAAQNQTLGALRKRGGKERRQGAALRPAADDGAVNGFCAHHGDEVLHPRVERRRGMVRSDTPVPRLSK